MSWSGQGDARVKAGKNVNILDMSVLYTDRTVDVALSWGICLACVRLQAQSPMLQRNDKSRQKPTLVKE